MRHLLKFYMLTFMTLFCSIVMAQTSSSVQILDKAASSFKSAGGIKASFTISADGHSGSGTIKMSGNKFVCTVGSQTVWFNGKTMWTYVKDNEEVNVTNPTTAEISKMNPYTFLSMYKKGYSATKGNSTKLYHEVVLTPTVMSDYKKIIVRFDKSSYRLLYANMQTDKSSTTINVTSYSKGQKYSDSTFSFNKKNYPDVEVIDLR